MKAPCMPRQHCKLSPLLFSVCLFIQWLDMRLCKNDVQLARIKKSTETKEVAGKSTVAAETLSRIFRQETYSRGSVKKWLGEGKRRIVLTGTTRLCQIQQQGPGTAAAATTTRQKSFEETQAEHVDLVFVCDVCMFIKWPTETSLGNNVNRAKSEQQKQNNVKSEKRKIRLHPLLRVCTSAWCRSKAVLYTLHCCWFCRARVWELIRKGWCVAQSCIYVVCVCVVVSCIHRPDGLVHERLLCYIWIYYILLCGS